MTVHNTHANTPNELTPLVRWFCERALKTGSRYFLCYSTWPISLSQSDVRRTQSYVCRTVCSIGLNTKSIPLPRPPSPQTDIDRENSTTPGHTLARNVRTQPADINGEDAIASENRRKIIKGTHNPMLQCMCHAWYKELQLWRSHIQNTPIDSSIHARADGFSVACFIHARALQVTPRILTFPRSSPEPNSCPHSGRPRRQSAADQTACAHHSAWTHPAACWPTELAAPCHDFRTTPWLQ